MTYQLYELTQNKDYIVKGWTFSSRTKAPVLLENLWTNSAKGFAGVSAEDLKYERMLITQIAVLEKTDLDGNAVSDILPKTKSQLNQFQDSLKQRYPKYDQFLKTAFNNTPLSISTLQSRLEPQQLLVEYAFSDSALYIFGATKTDYHVFKKSLNKVDFETQLRCFYRANATDSLKYDAQYAQYHQDFKATSFELYKILLADPLAYFSKKHPLIRITTILEGELYKIPFSALTDAPLTTWQTKAHYLVNQYAFSRAYTIQHLPTSLSTPPSRPFMGVALDFIEHAWENDTILGKKKHTPLKHSVKEVNNNAKTWEADATDLFINKKATKEVVIKQAALYNILTFSTHGSPEGLVFAKKDATDTHYIMQTHEFYGLQLNADLCVLSACETGLGNNIQGEGVMNLGRAISFSGVRSVAMTLWSVPDSSIATININFQQYCREGFSKDVALQKATLDYLKNAKTNEAFTPQQWAALTLIGDIQPITKKYSGYKEWLWAGILGILSLFFIFKRRKISKILRGGSSGLGI